jgi:hypothetical protein
MLGREKMLLTFDYFKKNIPGFEESFIVLSSPQLGTRGARRVHGDYMVTSEDLQRNEPFPDTIAVFPDLDRGKNSLNSPLTFIPTGRFCQKVLTICWLDAGHFPLIRRQITFLTLSPLHCNRRGSRDSSGPFTETGRYCKGCGYRGAQKTACQAGCYPARRIS